MAIAVLCPGQGAQTAGFLRPWLEVDSFRDELRRLSTRAYFDLARTGSDPDADVVDTAVAQPLLVATGIAAARQLGPLPADCVVVGHSVGELTALAVAGMTPPAAAVDLARERGSAMAKAAGECASGMTAVLGGDIEVVEAAVTAAGCWVANRNGAGQVVAAGTREALARLDASPPVGARLRRLDVAAAFHTPLMGTAQQRFAAAATSAPVTAATAGVVANSDGRTLTDPTEFLAQIAQQMTAPVRFDLCLETLRGLGVTATIELAPGGVLTGLVRRALPDVDAVALRTPTDLDNAHRVLVDHSVHSDAWSEPWRVLVAPAAGTLRAADGVVANRSGDIALSPQPTGIVEWLAHDGDPVSAGQPVARIAPAAS